MKRILCSILMLMFLSLLSGCAGKTTISYMREDVTLDFVNKVCVLPLTNNTDQKYAAELARDVISTQILAMNIFDLVDKGIVDSVLYEEALDPGAPVSQLMLSRLGQRLNVQAIMVGAVDLAGDKRVGSVIVPEMSLTLRLIETKSGLVLWQGSGHYAGDSIIGRLFGITPDDTYKVTAKLARELLTTIPERENALPPAVPEPAAVTPAAVAPVTVKPVTVKPVPVQPAVEEAPVADTAGAMESLSADTPAVPEPPAAEPVAEPVVEEPVAEPAATEPAAAEPVAEEPVAGETGK
ncbi:MAG: hypothetical protein HY789_14890 [Deltaproteobacteria bacterium]|nr:hypothetical protein [Deltaproteobacteria bacterium]